MSTKRRIQNRRRTFGPRATWPAEHNETVRLQRRARRQFRRLRLTLTSLNATMRQLGRAANATTETMDAFVTSVLNGEARHDPRAGA